MRAYPSNLFENGAYPSNFGRGLSEQEVGLMRAIILKMGLISVITRRITCTPTSANKAILLQDIGFFESTVR